VAVGAEIVENGFQFGGVQKTWQGLDHAEIFIQKYRGRVAQAVVEPFDSQFVRTPCAVAFKVVGFVLEHDILLLFGVEFYGVIVVVEVLGYKGIGKGAVVHPFAPAAPVGVHIDEDFTLFRFGFFQGFVEGHPVDFYRHGGDYPASAADFGRCLGCGGRGRGARAGANIGARALRAGGGSACRRQATTGAGGLARAGGGLTRAFICRSGRGVGGLGRCESRRFGSGSIVCAAAWLGAVCLGRFGVAGVRLPLPDEGV